MRENRMRERFCRHAAEGQVSETLTRDLFSRLTFCELPCARGRLLAVRGLLGVRLFFSRVKKLTRGAGVGHFPSPCSPETTWCWCLVTFP